MAIYTVFRDTHSLLCFFVGRIWFGVGFGHLHIDNGRYMAASLRMLDT